jgi:hypothetical protein
MCTDADIAVLIKPSPKIDNAANKLGGIVVRKERWGLSWPGRLLSLGVFVILVVFLVLTIHPFLAVTTRVNSDVLVVEGWLHPYAIRAAAEEYKSGSYQRVYTTGGPVVGNGRYVNDYQTSASVAAGLLRNAGVPPESVQMAPCRVVGRERTYNSATALRDWFRDHNLAIRSFNVLTEDCHARRTQLLYQQAFGRKVNVGIISVSNPDYDPRYWWRYSDGVREVIGESIAYTYAKAFFWPSRADYQPLMHTNKH